MKFVYGIWPFSSQVWNFKKPKITICKVGLLESVSNGGEKLSEPWQFKKLKHLIGRKELFYVKLKNPVKSQCGNLMILHSFLKILWEIEKFCQNVMILHSISQISCEITFMQMQNLCFWQIWRFWIGIFSHFLHFLEGWIVQNWNGIQCTLFFCTFWTDFTTVWWYLKDLPQWLHLNWLIYCHI